MKISRKKLIAGNWKMNGTLGSIDELKQIRKLCNVEYCELALCPPSTLLTEAQNIFRKTFIKVGAQNCHEKISGAYTGEISAEMLADIGVEMVILGHSERREQYLEKDALVREKASTVNSKGLTSIICVGETEIQKKSGQTETAVLKQLKDSLPNGFNEKNTVVAYEPVWAIGSGITPTYHEIADVHSNLRSLVAQESNDKIAKNIRIIYGGSVKPTNARDILNIANVDGALVGGASLIAKDLSKIVKALSN